MKKLTEVFIIKEISYNDEKGLFIPGFILKSKIGSQDSGGAKLSGVHAQDSELSTFYDELEKAGLEVKEDGPYLKWYNPKHWEEVDKNNSKSGWLEFTQHSDLKPLTVDAESFLEVYPEDQRDIYDIWKKQAQYRQRVKSRHPFSKDLPHNKTHQAFKSAQNINKININNAEVHDTITIKIEKQDINLKSGQNPLVSAIKRQYPDLKFFVDTAGFSTNDAMFHGDDEDNDKKMWKLLNYYHGTEYIPEPGLYKFTRVS